MFKYFQHKNKIPLGKSGEFSKITEEYFELKDADEQHKMLFSIVESADLIGAIGKYTFKQYKIPLILIILFTYIRKPYKLLRNFYKNFKYGKRTEFYRKNNR